MSKIKDLTGQKFNRLTVIRKSENTYKGRTKYICKCDCGNIVEILGARLTNGSTKSCGCLQKEKVSNLTRKDLTGQRFGKLTVLEQMEYKKGASIVWKCKCDCGNIIEKTTNQLTSKRGNNHCGCERRGRKAIYRGEKDTVLQWAKKFNKPYTTLIKIMNAHPELDFDYIIDNYDSLSMENFDMITFMGETLPFKTMCVKYNQSPSTVKQRLNNGWGIEDAFLTKPKGKVKITVFQGSENEFTGLKTEICKHFGTTKETINSKMRKNNMTFEEALKDTLDRRMKTLNNLINYEDFNGTKRQFAEHFNMNLDLVIERFKNGFTPEEVLSVPVVVPINKILTYKNYKANLPDLCNIFRKDFDDVYRIMHLECKTLEYAMEHAKDIE